MGLELGVWMSQPYPLLRISRPLQARLLGPCAETLSRSAMLFSLMVLLSLLTTCYSLVPLTLYGHPGLFNSEHPWPRFIFFPKLLLETMEIKGYSQSHWIRVRRLGGQKKKKKNSGSTNFSFKMGGGVWPPILLPKNHSLYEIQSQWLHPKKRNRDRT